MKKISVIIPCRNEEKYIKDFLNSVLANDYPKELTEVILVDGNSNDSTREIITDFLNKFSFIRLLINEKQTVPNALNLGIKESKGDLIFILGAHSKVPTDYFSKLVDWSVKLNADNLGAVCRTEVKNKSKKTNSIIRVLSHKFGVGNSFFRIGSDKVKEVDNISFGCYDRKIYDKIGYYDSRLERNQDIELNKRLKKNGGKIFLVPDVYFTYYARETFKGLARNNFQTGLWNLLTVYYTKNIGSVSLRHLIPLMFILSLILPAIIGVWVPLVWVIAVISLISYLILLTIISFMIRDNSTSFGYILLSFLVLHLSYGLGSLLGLFRIRHLLT